MKESRGRGKRWRRGEEGVGGEDKRRERRERGRGEGGEGRLRIGLTIPADCVGDGNSAIDWLDCREDDRVPVRNVRGFAMLQVACHCTYVEYWLLCTSVFIYFVLIFTSASSSSFSFLILLVYMVITTQFV